MGGRLLGVIWVRGDDAWRFGHGGIGRAAARVMGSWPDEPRTVCQLEFLGLTWPETGRAESEWATLLCFICVIYKCGNPTLHGFPAVFLESDNDVQRDVRGCKLPPW